MTLFVLVLGFIVIAMALMGAGLLLTRRPLQRGCGKEVSGGSCNCASDRLQAARRSP
jgi:hypothetical protein